MSETFSQVLIDTDVVIELLRRSPTRINQFAKWLDQHVTILLSPIVIAEVYAGAFEREYAQIEEFFALCKTLAFDAATAKQAGIYAMRYRKSHAGISLEDMILAATARALNCPLWTRNHKHYPMRDIVLLV